MASSASALAGIELHGLAWRAKLPIKAFIPVVPEMDESQVPEVAKAIHKRLEAHSLPIATAIGDFFFEFDDFNFQGCKSKDDLLQALTDLYDWADFERVLIC